MTFFITRKCRSTCGAILFFLTLIPCFAQQQEGQFWRTYWYQRGLEFHNPAFDTSFRVNAPDVVLHPLYNDRPAVRENGLMLIPIKENLTLLNRAELYLEMLGGNPGTTNRRVIVNGRSTYPINDVGTAANHSTHQYPAMYLQLTDLVNGYNAFQFACDRGRSNWGQFTVNNAALRVELRRNHPDLMAQGLYGFNAMIKAEAVPDKPETVRLKLLTSDESLVSRVEYQAFYFGYDENGDGAPYGWHGMTKNRASYGFIDANETSPFVADWDTAMLSEQQEMAVRAIVYFKGLPELSFMTPVIGGLVALKPRGVRVHLAPARELPAPFWSRRGEKKTCLIDVESDPERIEQAELNIVWRDGGDGKNANILFLNGQPLDIASQVNDEIFFRKIKVDPKLLKKGANRLELISDSDQHGIEILLPGPALVIRSK